MVRHVGNRKQKALDRLKQSALANKLIKKEKNPKVDKLKGKKRALPAIVVDIDGVVVKGKLPISGAKETLRRVFSPIES
jgi:ribonucleotide monophosphatase NagD (HAD superfamily)